jgi:hypothetical protein
VTAFTKENIDLWDIVKKKATAIGNSLVELPPLTERVLRKAERGDFHIKVSLQDIGERFAANTQALDRLTWVMAFGFVLGSSDYLLVNHYLALARYGFAVSAVLLIALIFNNSGGRRRRRIPHPPPFRRKN